jgi:uncharacterized protein (TIGR02646 family)
MEALWELSQAKCAYCETPESSSPLLVDHFRPLAGALGLDGSYFADHYWWLAYEWENLLPVCTECATAKGTRFPIRGKRAHPRQQGHQLADECPQLLDPCSDDPEAHLVYSQDGYVSSITDAGKTTIECLTLNRDTLVRARAEALRDAQRAWEEMRDVAGRPSASPFQLLDTSAPYAGIRRQFAKGWLTELGEAAFKQLGELLGDPAYQLDELIGGVEIVGEEQQQRTRKVFGEFEERMRRFTVAPEIVAPDTSYYVTTRTIRRIEIRNFKILKQLDLNFPEAKTAKTPWLMLLGENGLGKSSVLQAVTLALMGSEYRAALELDARRLLSWGARDGSVTVHLTGSTDPIKLHFTSHSSTLEGTPSEPQVLLMAYGATRLLPRGFGGYEGPIFGGTTGTRFANVDNLFNPFVALNEPRRWLMDLDDERFAAVARGLKRLLPLEGIEEFEREPGGIHIRAFGRQLTLEQLSDGYQSVLALATDMMQVLLHRWPAVEIAEGIVAIDELEAHLHPSWRMRIVTSLREVFPRLQFLASTHDPMCLRGLEDGEVAVMRRSDENEVYALTDVPSVQGLRVDQLLTSEIFGLDSTSDPEIDALLNEYRALRWQRQPTQASRQREAEVRARLDELQLLGTNTRERLVLEAVDEYLARERRLAENSDRVALKDTTKRRIAELFADAELQESGR